MIPAPIASGFLIAPPSSAPMISSVVYILKSLLERIPWRYSAFSSFPAASVIQMGCLFMISYEKEGPVKQAILISCLFYFFIISSNAALTSYSDSKMIPLQVLT